MFTLCRGQHFRCLVSSVVSLYLILNTFVYATEIFPRVFCHSNAQSNSQTLHDDRMTVANVALKITSEQSLPISGSQYQPATKYSHEESCPDCKSSFGHHLMALFPLPASSLPFLTSPEIETVVSMLSEYRDSLTPPPPKPRL